MGEIFISYARANASQVRPIATGLEAQGRNVWWDEKLRGGDVYGMVIEDRIRDAEHVLVAWSVASRRSVWVRGEALEAFDAGKLVQITLDDARPPVPFNAIQSIDFVLWSGDYSDAAWMALSQALDRRQDAGDKSSLDHETAPPRYRVRRFVGVTAIGGDGLSTALALVAPATSAAALASARYDLLNAQTFTLIAAACFAASAIAIVSALARWARLDTTEPR